MLEYLRLNGQASSDWPSLRSMAHRSKHHVGRSRHFLHAELKVSGSHPPPNESIYYGNRIHEAPGKSPECHEAPVERLLVELGPGES